MGEIGRILQNFSFFRKGGIMSGKAKNGTTTVLTKESAFL